MNRLEDAKVAFEKAIELLPKDDDESEENLVTYQGQLKYVNAQLSKK